MMTLTILQNILIGAGAICALIGLIEISDAIFGADIDAELEEHNARREGRDAP